MANDLSPSAQKVQEALNVRGLTCRVVELPPEPRTLYSNLDQQT